MCAFQCDLVYVQWLMASVSQVLFMIDTCIGGIIASNSLSQMALIPCQLILDQLWVIYKY